MLVQADALIESADCIHRPGHLRYLDHFISEVGSDLRPHAGEKVLKLSGLTLAPGFINLHAHLDLAGLRNRLEPGEGFSDWLRQVISCLPELTPEKRRHSIVESSRQARHTGTTSILSILSDPATLTGLTSTATRTWWALEFMDLHGPMDPTVILDRAKAWLLRHPAAFWHLALSPHSPYTATPALYWNLAGLASQQSLPFTTHLAESAEETPFLAGQPSALRSLLPDPLSRSDLQETNLSVVDWCKANKILPTSSILAHGNEIQSSDLPYLFERKTTIVHCPLAHKWFGRSRFPYDLYRERGISVCLGTDSPAGSSNRDFDLRKEAEEFLIHHPKVTPQEVWDMITTRPAQALHRSPQMGRLAQGTVADWVAWRIPLDQNPLMAILKSRQAAEWTCVGGVVSHHPLT